MARRTRAGIILALLILPTSAPAGLYYSGEKIAELPSQWRGFLIDQRVLRNIVIRPVASPTAGPLRSKYEDSAATLEKARRLRKLTGDEQADLGALYVRLGDVPRAIEVLRSAEREHARHFRILSNLGTAWQLQGD